MSTDSSETPNKADKRTPTTSEPEYEGPEVDSIDDVKVSDEMSHTKGQIVEEAYEDTELDDED